MVANMTFGIKQLIHAYNVDVLSKSEYVNSKEHWRPLKFITAHNEN